MTSSRVDLSSVIAGWQQKLLQLDRRNNLLYFKLGRGSVRILEHSPDEIDERLLSAKRGLSFPHGERVQIREDVSGKDEPAKRTDSETVAEDPSPDVELPESDSSGASSLEAALAAAGTPLATEPKSEDPTSGDGQAPQQNQPEVVAEASAAPDAPALEQAADASQPKKATSDSKQGRSRSRRSRSTQKGQAEERFEVHILEGDLSTPDDVFEIEERLKAIQRREREWQEEQGINVLFLATGFLGWVDEDGEEALAPLVLMPCDLVRRSPRDPFRLVRESDERVLNATLVHKLATAGIDLPPLEDGKLDEWFRHLREKVLHERPGWFVEEDVVLGIFSYSKLAMWQDMEDMRTEGVQHPLVRALAGDDAGVEASDAQSSLVALPPPHELAGGGLDDLLGVHDRFEVLDADHSQLRAIHLARSGSNLVIHGPPGTGKSQTIANIIASQIADGRRVLFVSEKTAALDVVKRRLVECGLGTFCLDLHSERAKKTSVYRQLAESLDAERPTVGRDHDVALARLTELRGRLNDSIRALHREREPLGLSVYDVCGRLAMLVQMPRIELDVPDIATLDPQRIAVLEELAGRVARREALFREHATSPWRPLLARESSVELPDRVRGDMQRIRAATEKLREQLDAIALELGVAAPHAPVSAIAWTPVLEHLAAANALPGGAGVPLEWLSHERIAYLRGVAKSGSEVATGRAERMLRIGRALSPAARKQSTTSSGAGDPSASSDEMLNFDELSETLVVQSSEADVMQELFGLGWSARLVPSPEELRDRVSGLREDLAEQERALSVWNRQLATLSLQSSQAPTLPERLPELDAYVQMLQAVVELGSLPAPWLEAGRIERLLPRVDEAERRLNEMQVARAALEAEFSDGITDVVDHEMRVRYRTDWQGFFRRLGGAYRRDDRLLRGYLKRPRKLSLEEALDLIERVMKVKKLEEEWKLDARQFEEEFGTRFQAADTSWRNLRRDLKRTRGLLSEGRLDSWCLRQVLAGSGVNRELREAAGRVQQTHERVGRGLQELAISTDLIEGGTVDELFASIEACVPLLDRITLAAEPLEGLITPEAEDLESVRRACEQSLELDQLEHEISKRAGSHRADFGARFNGLDTPWNDIARVLDWCERLLLLAGYENDDALQAHRIKALAAQASAPRGRDELAATEEGIRANIDVFVSELAPVALRFDESASPWGEWRKAPFEELERWTRDLETRAGSAADWIDYRRACLELENVLGDGLVDRIRDVSGDASLIPPIVLRRIWLAWIEHSFSQEPALAIAAADLQGIEADFSRWDRELPNIARARVRERAFSSYPETHSTSLRAGQLGTLRGELSKRRRQLPVRSLVTRIPGLLQVLKPCFLMSPLSVSQYLPRAERDRRGLEFDVVVFDEASQIFPEDAVPAIARAAQVIVVGDQQQLPPTQFFRAASSADVELEPQESSASQEAEPEDRFLGRESILDVMVGLAGQGVAAEYLTVHYRSQHSDLIRYSNHYFYGDRLFTFPGAARDDLHLGVHGRYLEDGLFDAGGSRTNRREAEVVVERVFELMRARPFQESIGVVTLSRTQADLIETLIAQRRRGEREFDERFALDLPERFFVKNLENVQGDERDHILLSLGYGPSEIGGTVANRFGPINQPGGERRLNVAVSRARRSMTVVHSMRPDQVTAQNEGARLLRSFLEFVHDPNSATSDEAAQRPAGDRHALVSAGVRAALEDAGHHVEERVGVAGYFIDLALRSEEGAGQYEIGLELDGPQCYATPAARDRDRLRPAVLGALGWTLYRLRATSWIRDPEGELARIEQAIAAARSQREQEAQGLADSQPMGRGAPDAPQLDTDQAEASGIDRAKAIGIDRAKAIGIDRAKAIGIDRVDAGGINQVDAAVSSESKSDPEAEARSSAQSGSAASIAASGESNTDHKGSAAEDEAPEGDAAIDDPADEGLLVPYLSAQLEDLAGKSELSEEDDLSWLRLTHRIVEAEGPIHRDLVFDRLRENFGSPRSTPKLRTRFDKALQMGLRGEQFEWLPKTDEDEDPNSFLVGKGAPSIVGRRPKAGEAARNIKLVAGQELEAALLRVVDALFGASDEDALGECARQLGYQRMGPAIARRLEAARDRLLASGSLVRQFDSLTCVTPSR